MKIVQINSVCGTGSTGKIAADICRLGASHSMDMYVAYGRGSSPEDINGYKISNPIDFISHVFVNFFQGKSGFGSKHVTRKFLKWLDQLNPDIIHLHNLHGFYINIDLLFHYIKKNNIPVIWTLHDCWALTGQCAHFDYIQCLKWQTQCHDCPIYRTQYPYSIFKDNSRNNYTSKKKCFTNVDNMTIIAPSQWLISKVKHSYLRHYPCHVIKNGINLEVFSPSSKHAKPSDSKVLLGVANVWTSRKGLEDFYRLSDMLPFEYKIVLIGVNKNQKNYIRKHYGNRITPIMRTHNQEELAMWYRSAYAYINTTYEDTFPTTNLEALACGTPVITYNTGGSPESLTHDSGIVVEKGNIQALLTAILSLEKSSMITPHSCHLQGLNYNRFSCFEEYIGLYQKIYRNKTEG